MQMSVDGLGLTQPVLLHSSRADTCKLTAAQCAYRNRRWVYWYRADWDYALSTVYFAVAVIGFFALVNVLFWLYNRQHARSQEIKRTPSPLDRAVAACRYLSYRAFEIRKLGWYSPSLGVMMLGLAGFVFFMVLMLAAKPYYWPNTATVSYGNSPPIATRCGWMAVALLPFVLASAAKWNFITLLTGVSHEKLQVFHRWTSWLMLVLALVHTFPFIHFHIKKHDMMYQWRTSIFYWTGVVALLLQAYLNVMSLGPVRRRAYEFFKATHHVAAAGFVVFFFLHCNFRLSSWDYFIGTAIVYGLSLSASWYTAYFRTQDPHRAAVEQLPDTMLRLTVRTRLRWAPGQHFFVRFLSLGVHALTNHPFSVCAILAAEGRSSEMCFYVREKRGTTARLAVLAGKAMAPVLLEGPYGGYAGRPLARFARVLLVAGGSGASAVVPLLMKVRRDMDSGAGVPVVHVLWCVHRKDAISWFEDDLERLGAHPNVSISIYITGSSGNRGSSTTVNDEDHVREMKTPQSATRNTMSDAFSVHAIGQRPDLPALIHEQAQASGTMAVAVCGPPSMLLDTRNATAALQLEILQARTPLREVFLHTEHFEW